MNTSKRMQRLAAAFVLALSGACSTLVGIDNAQLDPEFTLSCEAYCSTIMANCTGTHEQYESLSTCKAVCSHLPLGDAGADTGNTIACRLTHATAAKSTAEPATECPVAGPGGNGICGSNCEGYCTLMHEICRAKFATIAGCELACADVPNVGDYNTSITGGNSLQCRLYHVSAASQAPVTHCPHAAGEAICVAPDVPDGG